MTNKTCKGVFSQQSGLLSKTAVPIIHFNHKTMKKMTNHSCLFFFKLLNRQKTDLIYF